MFVDELERPILGKYRVISTITSESFVFTYIANSTTQTVFIRAISATHPNFNPDYLVACLREYEISKQLVGNTVLIPVLEYGSTDDTHYFVYEFIEGDSLYEQIAISRNRPLNNQTITAVAKDICTALQVLHSNGLFHGDLNAKNVLLTKSKKAFLKSYGTSTTASEDENKLDADIYALGLILYRMATCQQYRPGKSQSALSLNRNLTPALSTIISATLNEFGEQRYYNLATLQEQLELGLDFDVSPEQLLEQLVRPATPPEIVEEPIEPELEEVVLAVAEAAPEVAAVEEAELAPEVVAEEPEPLETEAIELEPQEEAAELAEPELESEVAPEALEAEPTEEEAAPEAEVAELAEEAELAPEPESEIAAEEPEFEPEVAAEELEAESEAEVAELVEEAVTPELEVVELVEEAELAPEVVAEPEALEAETVELEESELEPEIAAEALEAEPEAEVAELVEEAELAPELESEVVAEPEALEAETVELEESEFESEVATEEPEALEAEPTELEEAELESEVAAEEAVTPELEVVELVEEAELESEIAAEEAEPLEAEPTELEEAELAPEPESEIAAEEAEPLETEAEETIEAEVAELVEEGELAPELESEVVAEPEALEAEEPELAPEIAAEEAEAFETEAEETIEAEVAELVEEAEEAEPTELEEAELAPEPESEIAAEEAEPLETEAEETIEAEVAELVEEAELESEVVAEELETLEIEAVEAEPQEEAATELSEEEAFFAELELEIAAEKAEAARLAAELEELERALAAEEAVAPETIAEEEAEALETETEEAESALEEAELAPEEAEGATEALEVEAQAETPEEAYPIEEAAEEAVAPEIEPTQDAPTKVKIYEPLIEMDEADLYEALAKNTSGIAATLVTEPDAPTFEPPLETEPLMSAKIAPETKPLELKTSTMAINGWSSAYKSNVGGIQASQLEDKTNQVAQLDVPLILQHPGAPEAEKTVQQPTFSLHSLPLVVKIFILLFAGILLILLVTLAKAPVNTVKLVPNTTSTVNSSLTSLVSSLNIQGATFDTSQPRLERELRTNLPVLFADNFMPSYSPKWKLIDNKWNVVDSVFKTVDNRPGTLLLDIGAAPNFEVSLVSESFVYTKSLGLYFYVNGEPANGTLDTSKSYISVSFFNCLLYDINTKTDGKQILNTSVTTSYTYCNEETRYAKPIIIQLRDNALYIYTGSREYKLFKTDLPPGITVGKIGIVTGGVGISDIRIIGL
ncbi:MAG: protein kinase [Chloroflexi bacterium]|uniref:Protein kinase n=1 Tax=Candidatus Chlorohelix allophototropha TaxID=3003348 RepID=A0A8T7M8Z8_9CHLR|nr:protein kinase [Chloroflexota bacterium]